MRLCELYDKALKSEIYSLVYEGKLFGFRVKSYNMKIDKFSYYDFDVDIVKGLPEVFEFFKSKVDLFQKKKLVGKDDRLYTKEEILGNYEALELTDSKDAVSVLKPVILLYKRGYLNV